MNRILLFFTLFIMSLQTAKACDVINGSDIKFTHMGGYKYHIKYILYHQCVCALGIMPRFTVSCGGTSYTRVPPRTSIRDITPVCSSGQPPCQNGGYGGSRFGIEEHIFDDTIDFSKSPYNTFLSGTCCEIMFRVAQPWGLVGTTTTTTTYGGEAMMNLCEIGKKGNNSPTLSNIPMAFICCNQPFVFNNGIFDNKEYDSLSYNLDEPLSATWAPVNWISPLNKDIPFTPFCPPNPGVVNCRPLPNARPSRGFYFDRETGDMAFTPTKCDESGPVAIKVTEWRRDSLTRKMEKIGFTRRDIYVTIVTCSDNNPPEIVGVNKHSICEGSRLCFKIKATDAMFTPNQTVPDTVELTWNQAIIGASFRIIDPRAREKEAEFCWTPKIGDARNQAYTFTASAKDDACPRPATTIRGFNIKVNPLARDTRKYSILDCGKLKFAAFPVDTVNYNQKNYRYKYTIRDSTNGGIPFFTTFNRIDSFKFKRGGKYIIEHEINNPPFNCPTIYLDTVVMPPVLDVELSFGKDTFVCAGNSLTLEPIVANGVPNYKFRWEFPLGTHNPKDTLNKITVTPTTSSKLVLKLTDKNKCVDADTVIVKYIKNPIVDLGPDRRICTYDFATLDAQNADSLMYEWSTQENTREISVHVAGKYSVKVLDSIYKCFDTDTMELFVNDTVIALSGGDREICIFDTLNVSSKRKPLGYTRQITWRDIISGATMATDSAFRLRIPTIATRKYEIFLRVNQKGVICEDYDTFTLTVNPLPTFINTPILPRCYQDGAVNLNLANFATANNRTIPADSIRFFQQHRNPSWITGGPVGKSTFVWNFPQFISNDLVPKAGLTDIICYDYRDVKGCYNRECKNVRLNPNPAVELKTGTFCQKAGPVDLNKLIVKPIPSAKAGGPESFRCLDVPQSSGVDPDAIVYWDYTTIPATPYMDPGLEGENQKTGDYQIEYCFQDAISGCKSCDSMWITIVRLPEIEFSNIPKQCINFPLLAMDSFAKDRNTGKRFIDGEWSTVEFRNSRDMGNPMIANVINNSVKTKKIFDPSMGAGQYLLKLTDVSSGCPVADSLEVTVNGLPILRINIPDTVCSSNAPFELFNEQPSGPVGTWSGLGVVGRDFNPGVSPKTKQYEDPIRLKYEYTNPLTGCSDSIAKNIRIQSQPEVTVTTPSPYQQCEGQVFTLVATKAWVQNTTWTSSGDGNFSNNSTLSTIYTHGLSDTSLIGLNGQVVLNINTIKEGVCPPAKDDIQLIIEPYPQYSMPVHFVKCEAADIDFTSTVYKPAGSSNLRYTWDFGNGETLIKSTNGNPQVRYDTAQRGWYNVSLTVHNQWGANDDQACSIKKDSVDYVRVLPQPKAAFSSDPGYFTTVAFPKFKFKNETKYRWGEENMSYLWSFNLNDIEDTSTQINPIKVYPADTTVYWVNLMAKYTYPAFGDITIDEDVVCEDSIGRPRKIGPDVTVFVPTAFSPERTGPKVNNVFRPIVNGEKSYSIIIMNRWGQLIWESTDKFASWDGTYQEQDAQQDVYIWHIKVTAYDGEKYDYEGTITLLR